MCDKVVSCTHLTCRHTFPAFHMLPGVSYEEKHVHTDVVYLPATSYKESFMSFVDSKFEVAQ